MANRKYSPATRRALRQARKDTKSVRDLRDSQKKYEKEALEFSKREDWFNPEVMDQWDEASGEASKLRKKADTHPFSMTALLQSAIREHGKPDYKRKKGKGTLMKREAADLLLKKLRSRRR